MILNLLELFSLMEMRNEKVLDGGEFPAGKGNKFERDALQMEDRPA